MDEQTRIAALRGMILQALDLEYPNSVSDLAVQALLWGGGYDLDQLSVRRHLEYLAGPGKEYIRIGKKRRDLWLAQLTPRGKDLLDGAIDDDPGAIVAR